MQVLTSVVLVLTLVAGAGSIPSPVAGGGDLQVVAGCDAECALVARSVCRPSFDVLPDLVADVPSASCDPQVGGPWFQRVTTDSVRAGATPIATRPRGPPARRT